MSEVAVAVNEDQANFEAAMAAMNAALEQVPAAETKPATTAPDSAQAAQTTPATPPTPPVAVAPPEATSPPPPSAKELERIAALEAREARIRDAEAKLKAAEEKSAEATKNTNAQWDAFARDPVGFVKRMRPDISAADAARIAESFYFDALGDKAPPEYRHKQEVAKSTTEVRTEVEQLRAELQELRESRSREAAQAQMTAYQASLRAEAGAVADAPIVKALIARNPGRAEAMLYEVARRAAVESRDAGAAEPTVLTGAQAAAKLEAILRAERDEIYGPAPEPTPVQNAAKSSPSTTITNQDASVQPTRTKPDLDDDFELRKAALKAAGLDPDLAWR